MTLMELIPQLEELSHEEKIKALYFLNNKIHEEEERMIFSGEVPAIVYTPFGMEEVALQVMESLKNEI
ncbi:MAG: hypothetical protein WAQ98_04680 [Blastocatellia bacterium]